MFGIQFCKSVISGIYSTIFWRQIELKNIRASAKREVEECFKGEDAHVLELIQISRRLIPVKKSEGTSEEGGKKASDAMPAEEYIPYNFAVYIDYNYQVCIKCNGHPDTYDCSTKRLRLMALACNLDSMPIDHLTYSNCMAFKRMVGRVIVCSLENEVETAQSLYDETLQYYNKRSIETFRFRQIRYTIYIYSFLAGILYMLTDSFKVADIPPISIMMLASLAGSFFTIVKNAGNKELDAECTRRLVFCDCTARAIVAMIMGTLTWYVLQSDVIFAALQKLDHHYCTFVAIAFASGLLDSFIPSLICKTLPSDCRDK